MNVNVVIDRLALLKLTLNEKLDTLNRLDSEIIELTADEMRFSNPTSTRRGYMIC